MPYEYDNPQIEFSKLEIANIFFCQTTEATQYIIVDVVRDPNSAVKNVRRFYIDPSKKSGHYWNIHDLPIDIEVDKYHSCVGRALKGRVDGLYTVGQAGDSGQLEFCPVINVYGSAPPTPVRLNLPGGLRASAIAVTRNADLSTDLFAMSGSSLYYFASNNQSDGAIAVPLISNDVIANTDKLNATYHNGVIILVGKNMNHQIYYTRCVQAEAANPSAWSVPVPILSDIEQMSSYINTVEGSNTIFAAGSGKLQKSTLSRTSGLWETQTIEITFPSIYFNPYTLCFSGTACTRDEGEETRTESDKRIYRHNTGYIPVRIHKEISGTLVGKSNFPNYIDAQIISPREKFEALQTNDNYSLLFAIGTDTTPSFTVRGVGENDWCQPRNNSEPLLLDAPLKVPNDLLDYVRKYSGGDQRSIGSELTGWAATALALHGANLAAVSGAQQYNFIGHSRGAVECIMAAWFLYAYGPGSVPINIFAIDPVPGPGEWYGILTQLPPNVVNYVGVYAWDQSVQPTDIPFMALVPRPNGQMTGQLKKGELGGELGSSWDSLADNSQLADPLAPSNLPQPQGYELYACRGRHSTVAGNTTSDGKYDPNNVSESVAPVPELVYKLARAYLTKWGTTFCTKSEVEENALQLRRKIHTDHAKFDAMGGGETRTSSLPLVSDVRPYVRRVSSISGRNPFNNYYLDDVVGDPPYKLVYPVTNERENAGWVKWKFL